MDSRVSSPLIPATSPLILAIFIEIQATSKYIERDWQHNLLGMLQR